jgi:hypothetical protein
MQDREMHFHFRLNEKREPRHDKDTTIMPRGGVTVRCVEGETAEGKAYAFNYTVCSVLENYVHSRGVRICRAMAKEGYKVEVVKGDLSWDNIVVKADEIAQGAFRDQLRRWLDRDQEGKLDASVDLEAIQNCDLILKQKKPRKQKEAATA